ncbi:hypothetical protein [Kitasatospora sp. NPDC057015]|uniref:hypothetical protein n=1 Tax=Kitasatospora sp. NPDC057015 TaxID=3346001 RepID=UPI0036352F4D
MNRPSRPAAEAPADDQSSDRDAANLRSLLSGLERSLEADRWRAAGLAADGPAPGE